MCFLLLVKIVNLLKHNCNYKFGVLFGLLQSPVYRV